MRQVCDLGREFVQLVADEEEAVRRRRHVIPVTLPYFAGRKNRQTGGFALGEKYMGVWQGVAMDFIKFQSGSPCPTLLRLADSGVARPQGG
jgi:hypothetical protein